MISFFKRNNDGSLEQHRNSTNGFPNVVDMLALHQVLRETEYELSLDGESDIAVFFDPVERNFATLKIDLVRKQYDPAGNLKYYHGLVNFDTGTAPWILTKKFYFDDEDNVIIENAPYALSGSDEGGSYEAIDIDKFNAKFRQNLPKRVNMGKIMFPVVTLTNTGADRNGAGTSDTAEASDILARLDIIEDAIDRAIKAAKTKIYNKKKNGSMDLAGQKSRNTSVTQLADDEEMIEIYEDPHVDGGGIQISDRSLDLTAWMDAKKAVLQDYYTHTGENVANDAHGNNQHTYEIQSKGDNKFRRGTSKKTQRSQEIKLLIEIIISISKLNGITIFSGLDEISINIDEVDIRKEYNIEDKVEKLMNLGLISKVQALMKLMSIDEMTAISMINMKKEHDKLNEEVDNTPKTPITDDSGTEKEIVDIVPKEEKGEE